jgi:N-acetylmuramic acid 6-phosphate etherase
MINKKMKKGGRLIYIGAGTSGRLGVIDAAECPPTYGVSGELISGIIAGGYDRMVSAGESAEDNGEMGVSDLLQKQLMSEDVVLGISVAGNAAYVADALSYARSIGCLTVGLTCNQGSRLDMESDISIVTDTGAEVITGSSRMKAGTAQKLILNMISTGAMVRTGRVIGNYLAYMRPTNKKLLDRAARIVVSQTGCEYDVAAEAVKAANGQIIDAIDAVKAQMNI